MVYFFGFLGGLALFLYGMQLMGEGLQRAAGEKLQKILEKIGFTAIRITVQESSAAFISEWAPQINAAEFVVSAHVQAIKPADI